LIPLLAILHYVLAVRNRWAGVLGDCDVRVFEQRLYLSQASIRPLVTLWLRYKQEMKTNAKIERDDEESF